MNDNIKLLSIIVPVYNEGSTIAGLLGQIAEVELMDDVKKEIIVVNDCSTDDTDYQAECFIKKYPELLIKYIRHNRNSGKGAAIHSGIREASGEYLLIQDADLEYDPREYNLLLKPVVDGFADVVFGSRFLGGNPHRILFFWHSTGNKLLTFLSNMFNNLNLTDMETGFKLFSTPVIKKLQLEEKRFGFEPEVTAKIAAIQGIRIYEVGISYYGRTYNEGKKIKWKDGLRALYCIVKYGLFKT